MCRKTNLKNQVFFNTATGCVKIFVNAVILIFLVPFIIHSVGAELFGLWTFIMSILSFLDLIDMGLANAVIKYAGDARAKNDFSECNKILSTLFLTYLFLAFFAFICLIFLSLGIKWFFSIEKNQLYLANTLLFILGLRSVLFTLPLSLFRGVLFAEQKISELNMISMTANILYAIMAFFVLSKGLGLPALALSNLISISVEYMGYFLLSLRMERRISISYSMSSWQTLKKMTSFSSAQFLTQIGSMVMFNSGVIIIKLFLGLTEVAIYAIPLRIMTFSFMLLSQFTHTLTPLIINIHARQEHEKMRKLLILGTKYALIPATFIAIPGIIFSKEILTLWIGSKFISGFPVLIILLTSLWITIFHTLSGDILQLTGYHHITVIFNYISIFLNLFFSIALVFPLGIEGVALGTLIATIVALILKLNKALSITGISFLNYIKSIYLTCLIPAVTQICLILLFKQIYTVHSILGLIIVNIPPLLLSAATIWFTFSSEEKGIIKRFFPNIRNKF